MHYAFITERITEEEYEYQKSTPRKELLGVAVKIALSAKIVQPLPVTAQFDDVGIL